MANNISLKKFKAFTDNSLRTGMLYIQNKAMAMKLNDGNEVNTQKVSKEHENNQHQRG